MTDHASLPCPCDACMVAFAKTIKSDTSRISLGYCPHTRTLMRATILRGRVVHWVFDAPCSQEGVNEQIAREEADLRQRGLLPPAVMN
jgi:hypothetical protein